MSSRPRKREETPIGVKITFGKIKQEMRDFGPWSLREHPVELHVDAYQHDQSGNPMTGPDGEPVMHRTTNGDIRWNLEWISLEDENRKILDNLNFSSGGQKRLWIFYTRAGLASGDEMEEMEIEPGDLDKTKWWIKPNHEVRPAKGVFSGKDEKNVDQSKLTKTLLHDYIRANKIAETQYTFRAKGCGCNVCQACDGENVNVDTRVSFDAFRIMKAMELSKFRKGTAATNGAGTTEETINGQQIKLCGPCVQNNHSHKVGAKDCGCDDQQHPPF